MRGISRLTVILLSTLLALYGQGNNFDKIRYIGGTIQSSVTPDDWDNKLVVSSEVITLQLKDGQSLQIDPARITSLSYGQEAHRRVGTMVVLGVLVNPVALFGLFHKTRLHYVGMEFTTVEGKQSGLLLQAHKDNYRAILAALRGATRVPISVAEEDRKYVPATLQVVIVKNSGSGGSISQPSVISDSPAGSGHGVLRVSSVPDGANVLIDGAFIGNTPAQLRLSAGMHKITMRMNNYDDWERDVQVLAESDVPLLAYLLKKGNTQYAPVITQPSQPAKTEKKDEAAEEGAIGEVFHTFRMDFVTIPAGKFWMGCSKGDTFCGEDENPRHEIQITKSFEMQKHEVTQALWQAVMGNNPSQFKGAGLPVDSVTWNVVQLFIGRLNARNDGFLYRLPTEAEWEYSARAATEERPSAPRPVLRRERDELPIRATRQVGQTPPNGYGLYDMLGNVEEWCGDWYERDYYKRSPVLNPAGPPQGDKRVLRGGSWAPVLRGNRVSQRGQHEPDWKAHDIGFRIVRERR